MSINVSPNNVYFLPNTNQHGLSLNTSVLTKNTRSFEFKVRIAPDWDKIKKGVEYAIVILNCKHLGLSLRKNHIVGSLWTDKPKQLYLPLDYVNAMKVEPDG